MYEKPRPCPFCGCQVEVINEDCYYSISCEKCGITFGGKSCDRTVALWNRRIE
jgi:hypothetical protein